MSGASKNRFWGPHPIDKLECLISGIVISWFIIGVWALVGLAWFSLTGDWTVLYVLGNPRVFVAILLFGSIFFAISFAWVESQGPHP